MAAVDLLLRHRDRASLAPYDLAFAQTVEGLQRMARLVGTDGALIEIDGRLTLNPAIAVIGDMARLVEKWSVARGIDGAPVRVSNWPAPAAKS